MEIKLKGSFVSIVRSKRPVGVMILTFLFIPTLFYGLILQCRELLYKGGILKKATVSVPVISIGNITMGGTGKTPMVEFVARRLSEKGKCVAILSRGYLSRITNHATQDSRVNDEYLVLSENLPDIPNLLGKNRVESAVKAIVNYGAECLILDDGFQHWKLERNLDIVVIDALNPFGFERLIPQGTLREPLQNLRRSHIFVLSHCDQCPQDKLDLIKQRLKQINNNAPIVETTHYPSRIESLHEHVSYETSWLNGKRVYAFCALGNPESFKLTLKGLGAKVSEFDCFLDHHLYKQDELDEIIKKAEVLGVDAIVTTQKDGVKIKGLNTVSSKAIPFLILKIEVRVLEGKDTLEAALESCVCAYDSRFRAHDSALAKG